MRRTYHGILDGNLVRWTGDRPVAAGPIPVDVMLDETTPPVPANQDELRRALDAVAACDPFAGVDPIDWQRQTRNDRSLPGRDGDAENAA